MLWITITQGLSQSVMYALDYVVGIFLHLLGSMLGDKLARCDAFCIRYASIFSVLVFRCDWMRKKIFKGAILAFKRLDVPHLFLTRDS